ncbi:hypothetical protein [Sulfolobus acidocaldarius]|uniref:Uncharacterized protein n=3 Tax=Sulfolobus acidocaldarius TaxID=2285 RepID=A0A0U2W6N1_9CREN|nr:hypothetical protein [Sulfolobus acidocaldarius]AGE74185.1 hypothetical protein SacRon12I_09800 [Sulfolobus acidocaldarius Ron12/I]AGE71912.1 hypothetical protein SacN8_09775 [Sulfolobus acidocaldarius N8]ALU29918.1 hypothetical protein ATY89_08185 [Sulfolobus acidocaldarius]ALU32660.1 hypothetical protein ATZ20_11205 [Sulfolobus acidocaldarius]WCM35775.1 hypothetical protein GO597_10760 [Sulfolobus acidocaldarius DSM 639]
MYLLLKGRLVNFSQSLTDYLEKRSDIIKQYPSDTFLWGTRRGFSYFSKGVGVFLYLSKAQNFPGGIVLYGELRESKELNQKY